MKLKWETRNRLLSLFLLNSRIFLIPGGPDGELAKDNPQVWQDTKKKQTYIDIMNFYKLAIYCAF